VKPQVDAAAAPLVHALSHVSIAVPDLQAAVARYAQLFGLDAGEFEINTREGVSLAYLDVGNTRLEFVQPLDEGSPLARFLERNPRGGLQHIAFEVGDVETARRRIEAAGGEFVGPSSVNFRGEPIAFVHPRSTAGVLIELEAASGSGAAPR